LQLNFLAVIDLDKRPLVCPSALFLHSYSWPFRARTNGKVGLLHTWALHQTLHWLWKQRASRRLLRAASCGTNMFVSMAGSDSLFVASSEDHLLHARGGQKFPLFWLPLSALQRLCRIQILLGKAPERRVHLTIRGQSISRASSSFSFPLMHSIFIFASLLFFRDGFVENLLASFPLHPTSRLPATASIAT
jgi:hypothetical protein